MDRLYFTDENRVVPVCHTIDKLSVAHDLRLIILDITFNPREKIW